MENIRQKVRWKQTFIQKAPMLGAFKNELSCIFSYVTIQLNICYSLSGRQVFGMKIISSHSLQTHMQDYHQ